MATEYKEILKNTKSFKLFKNNEFIEWLRKNFNGPILEDIWENRKEIKFLILNDMSEPKKCIVCNRYIKFNRNYYANTCSATCNGKYLKESGIAKKRTEKANNTYLERHGVSNPMHNEQVKTKMQKTNLERYGSTTVMHNDEIKNKVKNTNNKKYGADFPLMSAQIINKIKNDNLEKYGNEFPLQSSIIRDKIEKTNLEKYGSKSPLSNTTIRDKIKKTNLERYGSEEIFASEEFKEIIKKTNLEKYGTEHYSTTYECLDKIKKTNLERYGSESHFSNKEISEKIKNIFISKYGVPNPLSSVEVRDKIKKTNIERYGNEYHNRSHYNEKYIGLFHDDNIDMFKDVLYAYGTYELAELVNCNISTIHLHAQKNFIPLPPRPRSYQEQKIIDILDKSGIQYSFNDRNVISPLELDFYLPDFNVAFELNGVYWHSEKFGKDKNYHYNKWKLCQENGINLYSIFEDDFSDMWINKILHLCNISKYDKIHARKCEIMELDGKIARNFLDVNHLQGNKYSSINLGLYYKNELVSVMSFSNTRNNNDGVVELTRFCNKVNTQVVGGASKLLSHFIKNYSNDFNEIISFSDNTYSDGGLYETLGFDLDSDLKPDYKYVVNNKRIHKTNYRKSKIQQKFNLDPEFVEKHTEKELMNMLGYYRIWDCGKKKWKLNLI